MCMFDDELEVRWARGGGGAEVALVVRADAALAAVSPVNFKEKDQGCVVLTLWHEVLYGTF